MHLLWLLSYLSLLLVVSGSPLEKQERLKESKCPEADPCNKDICKLGEGCFCSGNETVLDPEVPGTKPQLVFLTFDDALTNLASTEFYDVLFGTPTEHTLSNPNGCALRGTHFVTHSYTDYSLVNKWWHYGHEIASHSITHRTNTTYWQDMTEAQWVEEMVGMRKITGQFAAIDPCELKGTRAPFLQGGGDTMFTMLENNNFKYDCTWPTRRYGYVDAMDGLYPYTLDYKSVQDCPIEPCPKCSHPKIWEQPLIDLEDEWYIDGFNGGQPCSMLDACVIKPHDDYVQNDEKQVYDMLKRNFLRVYEGEEDEEGNMIKGNRAPWGLYMHAAWFYGSENQWHFNGYRRFLEEIADNDAYPDVWIVPVSAGIDYMEAHDHGNSMSNEQLIAAGKGSGPFACQDIEDRTGKYDPHKNRCGPSQSCKFNVTLPDDGVFQQERYMTICKYKSDGTKQNCPESYSYPWLESTPGLINTCGGNMPCADCQP